MSQVCFEEDDYVRGLEVGGGQALWRADLSDGTTAIQDDHRPGLSHHSAWVRLKAYLGGGLRITRLRLQFRDNALYDILPRDADGYYFSRNATRLFSGKETLHFYKLGYLTNNKLVIQLWKVPELILMSVSEQDAASAGDCLILNGGGGDSRRESVFPDAAEPAAPGARV